MSLRENGVVASAWDLEVSPTQDLKFGSCQSKRASICIRLTLMIIDLKTPPNFLFVEKMEN